MQFRLDELIRRTVEERDDPREVLPNPHATYYGAELNERTLLPGDDASLAKTRYGGLARPLNGSAATNAERERSLRMLAAFLIVLIPFALAWFAWMALFVANDPGDQIRHARHNQFFGPGGPDDPFAGDLRGMDRFVLTARLKPDGRRRALTLLGEHSVLDVAELGIYVDRHTIFLTETEVIFLFEGKEAEQAVRALFDDPVRSALIGHWLPLFDGPLRRAQEAYAWGAKEMV